MSFSRHHCWSYPQHLSGWPAWRCGSQDFLPLQWLLNHPPLQWGSGLDHLQTPSQGGQGPGEWNRPYGERCSWKCFIFIPQKPVGPDNRLDWVWNWILDPGLPFLHWIANCTMHLYVNIESKRDPCFWHFWREQRPAVQSQQILLSSKMSANNCSTCQSFCLVQQVRGCQRSHCTVGNIHQNGIWWVFVKDEFLTLLPLKTTGSGIWRKVKLV